MTKVNFYKKLPYSDAKQSIKQVGRYTLVLNYGTLRGGSILILHKATLDDLKSENRLPYIYNVDVKRKLILLETVNYMDWENAKYSYSQLKTSRDVNNLLDVIG